MIDGENISHIMYKKCTLKPMNRIECKFQVGGNVPNVPPGAGGGRKCQDLWLSAGQSQRGHEGRCSLSMIITCKLTLLKVKWSTLCWMSCKLTLL